ncbi:putative nuclease HARBI1 [Prorops nasuta]|uniref:putative nuclease HARBI1 n=1 Tax=Prorops nasuta TaxID=863751 RepID=UPI0034CF9409
MEATGRNPRINYERVNYYETLNEDQFKARFRLTKIQFSEVLSQIENEIVQTNLNKNEIAPNIQLLVALRFYATGCFLQVVADFCGMCTKTAQQIVHRLSLAIAKQLFQKYVRIPRREEDLIKIMSQNFQVSGMIRVVGALDCVHVKIQSYGGEDAELWRNRKGFFSINVQCLVNSDLEIMDCVVRWPGSTHDSTIFSHSRLKCRFDEMEFGNGLILGDRGYRNHRYLMTPLTNPITPAEVLFNEAHIRTRCMVERCFGCWGRMFPVKTMGTRFRKPERSINVILATAVLYNITRRDKKKIPQGITHYLSIPQIDIIECQVLES